MLKEIYRFLIIRQYILLVAGNCKLKTEKNESGNNESGNNESGNTK
jgi:hypothetical protein